MLWIRGRNPSIRRWEKAADTSLRSRVWSGGSTLSMWREKVGPGRPSATTSALVAKAACMSLDSLGSLRAARASSYPRTSQAECPSARRTGCTGPRPRASAKSAYGSSRS